MPKRSTLKLTKRIVEKLEAKDKDAIYRDRELTGIGNRKSSRSRASFQDIDLSHLFFLSFTRPIGRRRRKHTARGIVSTQAAACRSIPDTVAVGSQG